jgi:hypothetical protein
MVPEYKRWRGGVTLNQAVPAFFLTAQHNHFEIIVPLESSAQVLYTVLAILFGLNCHPDSRECL